MSSTVERSGFTLNRVFVVSLFLVAAFGPTSLSQRRMRGPCHD